MDLGTIKLLGDRTLIRLRKAEDHTVTEEGLFIPLMENYTTDGGKNGARVSNFKFLTIGEVLSTTHAELKAGDTVTVFRNAATNDYFFPLDRTRLVVPFDGTILVPNSMIECKYGN